MSWLGTIRASALLLVERPGLIAIGSAGLLGRGGLLLFTLPFMALPTPVGIANWIGPASVTAAGPSERLAWLIALLVGAVVGGLALGTLVGAITDLLLFRAAREAMGEAPQRHGRLGTGLLLLRLVVIRFLATLPLGLALMWSAHRFGQATYQELILPDELLTPLVLRVLARTLDAVAIVVLAWLFGELMGGLAVRHHLRRGGTVPVALVRPLLDLVRRPVTTPLTFALGLAVFIVGVAPLLAVTWLLFGGVRLALGDAVPLEALAATVAFVAAWACALGVAGLLATWRGLAASFDVLRASRDVPAAVAVLPRPAGA